MGGDIDDQAIAGRELRCQGVESIVNFIGLIAPEILGT